MIQLNILLLLVACYKFLYRKKDEKYAFLFKNCLTTCHL